MTNVRFSTLVLGLFSFAVIGCGGLDPGTQPSMVDVKGTVTGADSKPVTGVQINFQVLDGGTPATFTLDKSGGFSGQMTPGKYTYYFTANNDAQLKPIPKQSHSGAVDRTIEVKSPAEPIVIKLS